MKIFTIIFALLFIATMVSCETKTISLKSDEDKSFYAMGSMFGQRLANLKLSDREIKAITMGLQDTAKGTKPKIEIMKFQRKIQEIIRNKMKTIAEKSKNIGKSFLEKFVTQGAQKTKSGLAYKIVQEGKGSLAKETDTVEVHYHGTLIDGTVFDSSKDRKKSVTFPLNRVIKGWKEGLQLVKEGGKIKLVIPSELGYGDQGAPPKIPGGSTLVFDVELIKIKTKEEMEKERKEKSKSFKKILKNKNVKKTRKK